MPIFPATNSNIQRAAQRLQSGELVAFPTETVYGLGAHALVDEAVAQIFKTKGRPATNPLIVHVANIEAAQKIVIWNDLAQNLAEQFWPGPLTLVLPRREVVPLNVSAGLSSVAIRIPAHPIALELLRAANVPVAAPSANRSGAISPTQAAHVARSLGADVWVLDGGECEIGLESTVLDLSGELPTILRAGVLGARELEPFVGPIHSFVDETPVDESIARVSPGMMERHYAPRAQVHVFATLTDAHFHSVSLGSDKSIGILAFAPTEIKGLERLMPLDANEYGRQLYARLHELDEANVGLILVEDVPQTPDWNAVRDRLKRASK